MKKRKLMSNFMKILAVFMVSVFLLNVSSNFVNAIEVVGDSNGEKNVNVKPEVNSQNQTSKVDQKELEELQVRFDSKGMSVNGRFNGVYQPNVLTLDPDGPLLEGRNVYTTDSVIDNKFKGNEPGKTLVGEVGFIPADSQGNPIHSIDVTVQIFHNVTKEEVNRTWIETYGEKFAQKYNILGRENINSSYYGSYTTEYKTIIEFTEDGNYILHIPEEVENEYLLAITSMIHPETGEEITISNFNRLFFAIGKGYAPPPEEEEEDKDDGHRYHSLEETTTIYSDMEPEIIASISSDKYDVSKGIPTSENLTYNLTADNALYNITTRTAKATAGVKDITIQIYATYPYEHTTTKVNDLGEKVTTTEIRIGKLYKTITTDYSYEYERLIYDVPVSNIYPVQAGVVKADKDGNILSSDTLALQGSNLVSPQVLNIKVENPKVNDVVNVCIGKYANKSAAQRALNSNDGTGAKNQVKAAVQAAIRYTGNVNYNYYGLNVTPSTHNGVTPVVAKASATSTNIIPSTYLNGTYNGSGTVLYDGANIFLAHPNDVIVHTPVVNNSKISSTSEFVNQKISIDPNKTYLMLDEQFTVYIPDNGTHNDIKGYGTRVYNSRQGVTGLKTTWGKIKDVKLPFDAYLHYTKNATSFKYFVKANTWLSESGAGSVIDLTSNSYTFTIPVWVAEQTYDIQTSVVAENAPAYILTEDGVDYNLAEGGKNSQIDNYVATSSIPVEVIGKIYDLRISASNDPGWSSIYSWANGTTYIDASEFPFGAAGQNRNTAYKYAPKLGYTFVFDFKTKGTKSNNIDISVQPEGFYFVPRNGGDAQPVDLYYDTTMKKNIKISISDNNVALTTCLRDAFMKVAAQEFVDSNRIYSSKYNYALKVKIGTFAKLNLPHSLRLCYNNFDEYVNALYGKGSTVSSISANAGTTDTVIGSVGHWYAGYRLPASTKAVPVGTNINTAINNNTVLTDGYIVVKFDIKTKYQNDAGNWEYLQYMGPEALNDAGDNTGELKPDWTEENAKQDITLPNGKPARVPVGSVAIYDAGLRSSNDVEIGGTH